MVSNVVGVANADLRIGMALEAVFDGIVPKFRPVTGGKP